MGSFRLFMAAAALLLGVASSLAGDGAGTLGGAKDLVAEIVHVCGGVPSPDTSGLGQEAQSRDTAIGAPTPVKAGLCVVVDCGDGTLVAGFALTGRFLAHGIASDVAAALAARQRLADLNLSGLGTVESLPLDRLPYADNLVNLLVAQDLPALLKKGLGFDEIMRVLAPQGQAVLGVPEERTKEVEAQLTQAGVKDFRFEQKSRRWLILRKPRPAGMDDWTHWNHAADGNLVSRDRLIDRPNQIQWIAGPQVGQPRQGVPGAGNPSAVRTAGGRNLYLMGRQLVARDAFNGIMLWSQEFAKAPDNHSVILAANEVYLLREARPVALDAATGKELRSYGDAADVKGLILSDALLLVFGAGKLTAYDPASAAVKWTSSEAGSAGSPVVDEGRMYFLGKEGLSCLALADGKLAWKKPARPEIVFAFGDKVLTRTRQKVSEKETKAVYTALVGKDGAEAWTCTSDLVAETYFAAGLVWVQNTQDRASAKVEGFHNPQGGICIKWDGLDPASGQVKRSFVGPVTLEYRCHTLYMTDRFLVGNRPMYFTDWLTGAVSRFEATRIACGSVCGLGHGLFYGLYTNSSQCMCMRPAMSGISAYACDGKTIDGAVAVQEEDRLEQGPAKAGDPNPEASLLGTPPESAAAVEDPDWPMYRHDGRRRSAGAGELPEQLSLAWEQKLLPAAKQTAATAPDAPPADGRPGVLRNDWVLNKVSGDRVNQPVAAGGRVIACLTHLGQVVAMDAKTGQVAWRFLAPARVDSPPALAKGLCLVGCNDGWLYALNAGDGQQVWRFRAAPAERRIVAYGQLESRWPLVGGPLVLGDNVYVLAGRTTEADGGLYIHALEVSTGKCLWSARRVKPDDGPIGAWNLRGVKDDYVGPADMLCCDGATLAISGHRTGRVNLKTGQTTSAGSYNAPRLGLMPSRYAADNQKVSYPPLAYSDAGAVVVRQIPDAQKKPHTYVAQSSATGWKIELPAGMRVEALATAGSTVLAALSGANPQAGELWVIGKDGSKLSSHPLSAGPVFEGLSVARGRVYVALQNGSVACFAAK